MVDQVTEGGLTLDVMWELLDKYENAASAHGFAICDSDATGAKTILSSNRRRAARAAVDAALADILARLARPADRPGDAAVPVAWRVRDKHSEPWVYSRSEPPSGEWAYVEPLYAVAPTPPAPSGRVGEEDPRFTAIWECIKGWDIGIPAEYGGYCGATGSHVRKILATLDATLSGQTGGAVPARDLPEIMRKATLFTYLMENCAYAYGNGYDEPTEHGIQYEWQQSTPCKPDLLETLTGAAQEWVQCWLSDLDPDDEPQDFDREMFRHAQVLNVEVPAAIRARLAEQPGGGPVAPGVGDLRPGLEEALRLIGEGREFYMGYHTEVRDWGDDVIKDKIRTRLAALDGASSGGEG